MYRVNLPHNKFQEYCKYKMAAYEDFFQEANRLCKKKRFYLNGNISYWFLNKDYKNTMHEKLQQLAFESIVIEVRKLK